MSVIRVKKDKNYFAASNVPFNDERLSWEARGVMGYLLSKPDDWQVRFADLVKRGPAGGHKIRRILKELEDNGYLFRERFQTEAGTFDWVSTIYETPTIYRKSVDGNATGSHKENDEAISGATIYQLSIDGSSIDGLSIDGKPRDILSTELINTKSINTELKEGTPEPTNGRRIDTDEYKTRILGAIKRGADKDYELKDAYETTFHLSPNWDLKTNRAFIQWLKQRPAEQTIEAFADWWYAHDWRGKKGEPPTNVSQVQELWPQAFVSQETIVAERTRNDERSRSKYSEWERVGK